MKLSSFGPVRTTGPICPSKQLASGALGFMWKRGRDRARWKQTVFEMELFELLRLISLVHEIRSWDRG